MAAAVASSAARIAFRPPAAAAVQQVVQTRWWQGQHGAVLDPSRFVVDCGGKVSDSDLDPGSALGQEMLEKYADVGLVHLRNTGLTDMAKQRLLARILMGDETEYEGGANPRGRTEGLANVYDIGAPLEAALHYHHEITYKDHSVESLGFLCKHAVTERPGVGWSFVSDSVKAHDRLMETELGRKLKDKGLCFIRRMTDARDYENGMHPPGARIGAVYNHWQKSWMTDDPDEAQAKANEQGLQVEWLATPEDGRIMQTRYYASAFEYVPVLDRNLLVTSIADDGEWFDSWPGIMDVPQERRPLEMLFGDDTPISLEEKQQWTDAYDEFGIPLAWQPGDVAVFCNMRFAHGRPGVELLPGERRELGVMLGRFFPRRVPKEGKW